jgi:U5 small nuclear ribonucleoprotein component
MANTEKLIQQLVSNAVPFFLVVNKIDRLILELKIPPQDAFFKLKHTIEQVNNILKKLTSYRLSPELGNVIFASTQLGIMFSLKSFADMYSQCYGGFDSEQFARRLWGDIYFDSENRSFRRSPTESKKHRTFTEFILEPLYKLVSHTISEDKDSLKRTLKSLGIFIKSGEYDLNMKPLLKIVFQRFFGGFESFTDFCTKLLPSPALNAKSKTEMTFTGDFNSKYYEDMVNCDPEGKLMIQVVKLYNIDGVDFETFGRVLSGTIKVGQKVRVLGEGYSTEDDEELAVQKVSGLSVLQARYTIKVEKAGPGNWVLIQGVDASILKTATITDVDEIDNDPVEIFKPLRFDTVPVLKVAVEPVNPTELPRMLDGLRKINKSYPIVHTKVEESGEHIIIGTGELYMDCVLHDLRKLYSEIDIKISDPVARLCETVVEVSQIKCFAETPNKKNKLTMICEPLEKGIAEDIETFKVDIKSPKLADFFVKKYEWDILASRGIWAFGPDNNGPNMLINDTLPAEVF